MSRKNKAAARQNFAVAGIDRVHEDFYVLKGASAIVEFTSSRAVDNLYAPAYSNGSTAGVQIAPWGKNNLQPQDMLRLVYGNHLKPQLIYTARDFLLGSRVGLFTRRVENNKIVLEPVIDPQIEDWMEMIQVDDYMRAAAYNLEFFHNTFSLGTLSAQKKVERLEILDCTDVRAELIRNGRINNYFYNPDWKEAKASETKQIATFDRLNPTKYGQFLIHGRDRLPGQTYYDLPPWWGTEQWTNVSNQIPKFHISGLKNGYNPGHHIKIPRDYFNQFGDPAAQKKAEDQLMASMNEMLSGVENVNKVFVSKFATDANGKPMPGWEIIPLDNKLADDAYSKVNDQANIAHASGHGLDPSLAGIDTGSKLGGSGSEKRISFQLHLALRTPNKRKILLDPLNQCKRINGFREDVFFGIEDVDLTTLAENPTGQEKVTNNAL